MGLLASVARVGCWRRRASVVLEEWSPIRFGGGQNPAYRPSGDFLLGPQAPALAFARLAILPAPYRSPA